MKMTRQWFVKASASLLVFSTLLLGTEASSQQRIRISIGTQDQVINTATGGSVIREMELLEKHLPTTGDYEGATYDIEWSSYTSGPPITNQMLAGNIDIGLMGDFPAIINMTTFRRESDVETIFIATLAYSATGAGNAVMVPADSTATSLADLKGAEVSVPFGSAAHGMLLKAFQDLGIDPETEVTLISQAPEVGGTSLRTNQIDAHANFVPFGELFPFRGFARKIFDGAQTNVPTMHGVLVRSDFAEEHPEIVVAYLKALLEANQLFQADPELVSADIEEWSSIEKEVVYMFLGPSGLQTIDPTIREIHLESLENSITVLRDLGRVDESIDPSSVRDWVDDSFLRQAMEEMGLDYDEVVATGENYVLSGEDDLTGEPIEDPLMAAQLWVGGEELTLNFASIENMLAKLQELRADGQAARVIFVHDRNNGWKLFAENSFFVQDDEGISAFLLEEDAQAFADEVGSSVMGFRALQQSQQAMALPE